ncbi:hypothetical protein MN0502_11310 [Arthrobacter sp. MN05-02]|nr:hypothetical protein MN0502_11310 [Arthrobacter sp. MN05-02]
MRLDHVSYACEPDGLAATADRISARLGMEPVKGGVHPRFGTRNMIFPLVNGQYLEVVEVLNHPASDKAPFGQAVRARSEAGGGWMGWCVAVDDLGPFEERLGRGAVPGNRKFPDGQELTWQQIGIKGLIADPQVPYLLRWDEGHRVPASVEGPSCDRQAGLPHDRRLVRARHGVARHGGRGDARRRPGPVDRAQRHPGHHVRDLRDRRRPHRDLTCTMDAEGTGHRVRSLLLCCGRIRRGCR